MISDCCSSLPADETDDDSDGYVECQTEVEILAWNSSQKQQIVEGEIQGLLGGLDCDDNAKFVYPTATEYCDGIYNDCSSLSPSCSAPRLHIL